VKCECAGLPPLVPTRFGKYARLAINTTEVLVSNYDSEFGDLVVAHYDLGGELESAEYVDGIPAGGAVVADPDGPRGGIAEVGANVGTHTSIAMNAAGNPRVAYRDEDAQALKVAIREDGKWQTHVVDPGANGASVGQFTDITVAAQGTIWISYLAHNITAPGINGKATALKVAKSRSANPVTPSDWDLFIIDARPVYDECNGGCGSPNACVIVGGAAQCLTTTPACVEECKSTQACVDNAGTAECLAFPLPPESPDVPRARGLYTSIVLDGTEPVVAYYDLIDGDVRTARVTGAGTATVAVLDGDGLNGRRTGDVGKFPAVTRNNGQLLIAYEDFARHELRVWQGTTPGTDGTYTTVDPGTQTGRSGKLFVGAGARVAHNVVTPLIVFQDASKNDLKVASPLDAIWVSTPLLQEGAHGYYADVAVVNGTAYIVSVLAELDGRGNERSRLGLTVQPAP
jgi:hypothetical protein